MPNYNQCVPTMEQESFHHALETQTSSLVIFTDDGKVTGKGLTSGEEVREHQAQFGLIN